jgi:hypothetical protein
MKIVVYVNVHINSSEHKKKFGKAESMYSKANYDGKSLMKFRACVQCAMISSRNGEKIKISDHQAEA